MNILDHIASTPLFQGLPKEHLEDLATVIEGSLLGRWRSLQGKAS
jgi:hypothetical protein